MERSSCPADIEEQQKFNRALAAELAKVLEILDNLEA